MNKLFIVILPILSLLTSGCASIVSGTDQDIAVHTNPEGAECILTREGQLLRKVTTPNTVRVDKLKHDIYVKCAMDGFHVSTAHVNSGTQGSTFGNILLGGGIGWAIDSARGADNKYAEVITVTMVPKTQAAPEVVMIGVDGKALTVEQVEELKAKQAATKTQEGEVQKAEDAVAQEVEEAVEKMEEAPEDPSDMPDAEIPPQEIVPEEIPDPA